MPRYFFHLRDGKTLRPDLEGSEHVDYVSARAEAEESAREVISQLVMDNRRIGGRTLEIVDEQGRCLGIISIAGIVRSLLD